MTEQRLSEAQIFAIERPESGLLVYYTIASLAWGPAMPVGWLLGYFRYHTMRYRFTGEGISMSWGILFRREIHLTYARIQDIHLTSNVVERWLGLARIDIQTASGKSKAEMTIEGIGAFRQLRDFLYERMRGARADRRSAGGAESTASPSAGSGEPELAAVLLEIAAELRGLREQLSRRRAGEGASDA